MWSVAKFTQTRSPAPQVCTPLPTATTEPAMSEHGTRFSFVLPGLSRTEWTSIGQELRTDAGTGP
jgi:hypothetical protein